MTPRVYRALADRILERERRSDARFGVMASVAANLLGGKKGGGQFQPSDFFPSLSEASAATTRPSGPTDEQIIAGLMGWAALCGTPAR